MFLLTYNYLRAKSKLHEVHTRRESHIACSGLCSNILSCIYDKQVIALSPLKVKF